MGRRIAYLLPVLLAAALSPALSLAQSPSQSFRHDWNPRTGDAWVDTWLADMNRYGSSYPDAFIDEIARYHDTPRALVRELLVDRQWAPGDVYYACALASVTGRPCRHVADLWQRDHAQGWGAIAQGLGVEPGSPAFHRLKKGFVPSYDRWGRPILVDDSLARDFPDRKRMPVSVKDEAGKDGGGKAEAAPTADKGRDPPGKAKAKSRDER